MQGVSPGDELLLHYVDLFRLQELSGVLQMDLLPHEKIEQVGIDVIFLLHFPQDLQEL